MNLIILARDLTILANYAISLFLYLLFYKIVHIEIITYKLNFVW